MSDDYAAVIEAFWRDDDVLFSIAVDRALSEVVWRRVSHHESAHCDERDRDRHAQSPQVDGLRQQ
jgi:hypothetical protein